MPVNKTIADQHPVNIYHLQPGDGCRRYVILTAVDETVAPLGIAV